MAVTGQAVSLEADSVILTPLRQGSVFQLCIVSSRRSSSNWMDVRVWFHCATSLWPCIRSFAVHDISPAPRNPATAMQKAPLRFLSRGSFASSSERMGMKRPREIGKCSFLFGSLWNRLIALIMRCWRWLPHGPVLSPRLMRSDFTPVW